MQTAVGTKTKPTAISGRAHLVILSILILASLGYAGCSGVVSGNSNSSTPPPADTTPPTISISSPAANATLSGSVNLTASASDNVSVASVQFKVDSANVGSSRTAPPYAYTLDTKTLTNGNHTITATATDGAGNSATSSPVSVKIDNTTADTTPPAVSITAPAGGATVSGTVSVSANASDNVSVASVQFQLDGANVGTADVAAPYSYSWNTASAANGSHTLRAVAKDGAGNSTTSAAVTVTVSNTTPDTTPPTVSIGAPAAGSTVSGTVNVTATASDNVGVASVQFQLDGANVGSLDTSSPYAYSWNTATSTNGTHTLRAIAKDAAGNSTTSAAVTVTVSNTTPDTTPPTVSLSAPAAGSTVSGTVNVTATASDNVGVASVQFQLDGANVGSLDTVSPYSYSWNTTASTNGTHTLRAVAKDAAGNSTTSAGVTVTVSNVVDTTAPSVPTGLSATAVSSSQINLSWTASADNVAVTGYKVFRNGTQVGTSPTTTYQDGGLTASTSYSYTVAATDAANNTSAQSTAASATTQGASSGGGQIPNTLGWYQIPNTKFSTLCPSSSTIQGSQGCTAVMSSWGGGTADTTRNRLLVWGGGHADYFGNEVYALNLSANPITISRIKDPTTNIGSISGNVQAFPDGNPSSRHTYDGLVYSPSTDEMLAYGGSLNFQGGFFPAAIWALNLSSLTWSKKIADTSAYDSYIPTSAYDPNTGLIYFHDMQQLNTYNPTTKAFTAVSSQQSVRNNLAYSSLVVDPVHKYVFLMGGSGGGGTGGQLYRYDVSGTPPYPRTDLLGSATGCSAYLASTGGNSAPGGPGVAWDPVRSKIVMWNGGNSVGIYDPTTNSCTTETYTGGPGAQQTHGTYGRFSYFPGLGVFALCNDMSQNCYALRIDPPGGTGGTAAPVVSSISTTSITASSAMVDWTTDVGATSQVEYGTTTAYGSMTAMNSNLVTSHSVQLASLAANTLYHQRVHSKNSSGVETISGDSAFQTSSSADSTPPTISISSPTNGATVSGTVTLSATASDNVGVTSVQFQLDGANLGSALTAAPYSVTWNTTTASNVGHILTAQARDAAGNVGTAISVSVTVSNSGTSTSADQNFQNRCAAPGVLNCQGFDTTSVFNQQVDFTAMTDGFGRTGNPNNIRDTTVFLSGASSAKFHIPANAGENCCANWFAYFGQGSKNLHFNENSTFYVQYAFRADATWTSTNWTSDAGSTWPKLSIFHSLLQGFGGVPGSCADMEITTINIHVRDVPVMYTECGQRQVQTSSDGILYNENGAGPYGQQGWTESAPFTGYQCAWSNGSWNAPNCFNFQPNQWYTLYWKISIGTWGSPNSTIEAWVAPYGQQMKKWINVHNYILTNDPPSNCNGLSPCPGFNVLELTQFMTAHTGSNSPADVWYDELIISSQPIPAPGGQTP